MDVLSTLWQGIRRQVPPPVVKPLPGVSPKLGLQTLGMQLGYSMKLVLREGLGPAKHEMQAVYSAPITSHHTLVMAD